MAVKILKFGADWCNACKQADRYLDRTEKDRSIEIERIDVDSNEELAIKFGIKSLPTFIVIKNKDTVVRTMIGFDTKKLESFIKSAEEL